MESNPKKLEGSFKKRILSIIEEGPTSISEVSRVIGGNKEFVSGYLHGLADCGILRPTRVGKAKVFLKKETQ